MVDIILRLFKVRVYYSAAKVADREDCYCVLFVAAQVFGPTLYVFVFYRVGKFVVSFVVFWYETNKIPHDAILVDFLWETRHALRLFLEVVSDVAGKHVFVVAVFFNLVRKFVGNGSYSFRRIAYVVYNDRNVFTGHFDKYVEEFCNFLKKLFYSQVRQHFLYAECPTRVCKEYVVEPRSFEFVFYEIVAYRF